MDDLEDEDMDKMNEALSNIFKTLCKKKSQGEKKKEMMDKLATMHFKIRTIDMVNDLTRVIIGVTNIYWWLCCWLVIKIIWWGQWSLSLQLEIYLSHEPKLAHVLFLIQPAIAALEDAIKDPTYEPLVNRWRLDAILVERSIKKNFQRDGRGLP